MTAPRKDKPALLTTAQLAERWHTTPGAIRIRRSRGNAPKSIAGGKTRLYRIEDVEEFERASAA